MAPSESLTKKSSCSAAKSDWSRLSSSSTGAKCGRSSFARRSCAILNGSSFSARADRIEGSAIIFENSVFTAKRDTLFNVETKDPEAVTNRPFRFDAAVAEVFDDMVTRSVPGYYDMQLLTAKSVRKFC